MKVLESALNYDQTNIPEGYDRSREHGPAFRRTWAAALARHIPDGRLKTILDLGCGTGRFSQMLREQFATTVVAVDPSIKMLRQAAAKSTDQGIQYALATAEGIPLRNDSVDLIFISMVFHHFTDRLAAAAECFRVLRPGGRLCLRTATSDNIESYPYVPYFPSTRLILQQRLPSLLEQTEVFERSGLSRTACELITQEIADDFMTYAAKLEHGGDSVLATLTPEVFADGLRALRTAAAGLPSRQVREPIDFVIFSKIP